MNAGAKEGFVGVNIAHAAEEFLIEEQGLDAGAAALGVFGELLGR